MVYDGVLQGRFVELKSATVEDAEFTLKIRQDPEKTKFLPALNITLEQQKEWILKQREKEGDYFFVVWSLRTGERLGTVSVYDICEDVAEGGRLALYGEPFEKVEAGVLMSEFQFNILKLQKVTGWIYCDNTNARQWNKSFGAVFGDPYKYSDGKYICNVTTEADNALIAISKLKKVLYKISC